MQCKNLPLPRLAPRTFGALTILTDDALASSVGVYMGFTQRGGGASKPPYDSLNLGSHVGDVLEDVEANRTALLEAIGFPHASLVVPNQVHGTDVLNIASADPYQVEQSRAVAQEGIDALIVSVPNVAALLCFADCVPVVLVSPSGRAAVAHAGWKGAYAGIVGKTIAQMVALDVQEGFSEDQVRAGINVYLGPHIHGECFEVGADVAALFQERFGNQALFSHNHVDLSSVLRIDAQKQGVSPDRIVDAGECTKCSPDRFYSYRQSGGTCGRHGAFALKEGR